MFRVSILLLLAGCLPKVGPTPSSGGSTAPWGVPGQVRPPQPGKVDSPPRAEDAQQEAQLSQAAQRRAERQRESFGDASAGRAVARAVTHYTGHRSLTHSGDKFRYDCSGLINAAYARAGMDLGLRSSEGLFELTREHRVDHRRKVPFPGDVVFFDNTYDANRNGRLDDALSHVAIVVSVDDDGTVTMVHKGSKGVVNLTMNTQRPSEARDASGKVLNSYLRAKKKGDKPGTKYMAGEMWRGYGSLWRLQELAVVDAE